MEEKNEIVMTGEKAITQRWGIITIVFYAVYIAVMWCYRLTYVKPGTYNNFYLNMMSGFIFYPGVLFFIIGYLINKIFYYKNNKIYLKMISYILLICVSITIGGKYMKYSGFYKDLMDLKYVTSNTYCEEIQELKKVYVDVIKGKITTKTLYIETENLEFQPGDNIVTEDKYNEFVEKYKYIKKVKVKYLPNTNSLLSIEPADDAE